MMVLLIVVCVFVLLQVCGVLLFWDYVVYVLQGDMMGIIWFVCFVVLVGLCLRQVEVVIMCMLDVVIDEMSYWVLSLCFFVFNCVVVGMCYVLLLGFVVVMQVVLQIVQVSGGVFDFILGDVVCCWGFGLLGFVDEMVGYCGWCVLVFDGQFLLQLGGVWLDFLVIVKGYVVDCILQVLEDLGIVDYLVEVGGELCGVGMKFDG